ncbi:hypothetical protein [Martelella sp. FOR1707]
MDSKEVEKSSQNERRVPVMLRGAVVMEGFQQSLFDAANRAGMTPNEYVLEAAAEKLRSTGRRFSGLFSPGDIATQ